MDKNSLCTSCSLIIPGATWKQKTWLSERYSEVIDYIINKLKYKVVMLGGGNDNIVIKLK